MAEDNPEAKNGTSWEGYDGEELKPPAIADLTSLWREWIQSSHNE